MQWVLASTSPRRQELLATVVSNFEVRSPKFDEVWRGETPRDYVLKNAVGKNLSLPVGESEVLVSADTIVVLDEAVLEKPRDKDHAISMLKSLSGRSHQVITGMCVRSATKQIEQVVVTDVLFRTLRDDEIVRYVESGEPMDKSGSYGIQGLARSMVSEIHGSYTNVMGLPLAELVDIKNIL